MEFSNFVLTAISTVGFPIVVAGAMFWKMNKQDTDHKEEMNKLTEAVNASNNKITEAINNNSLVIQKLIDKME